MLRKTKIVKQKKKKILSSLKSIHPLKSQNWKEKKTYDKYYGLAIVLKKVLKIILKLLINMFDGKDVKKLEVYLKSNHQLNLIDI